MTPRARVVVLIALLLPMQSVAFSTDLLRPSTRSLDGLPYEARETAAPILPWALDKSSPGYLLLPPGSDGTQRIVRRKDQGLLLDDHDGRAPLAIDQLNLPADYASEDRNVSLAHYATDPARPEEIAVATGHADGGHWRVWLADIEAQSLRGDLVLPAFPERYHDGRWDGSYWPVGALPIADRTTPALLMICDVEHDVHGRGLLAVDPLAGEVLWRVILDARLNIVDAWIGDLEGDGASEVVVSSRAVNNLKGERLYGAGDDSSRVFVFGADGTMRWQRALGGPGSSVKIAAIDLDADLVDEVVVATAGPTAPRGRLAVLRANGVLLDEHTTGYDMATNLVALPATPDREALLAIGDGRRVIRVFALRDGALVELRRTDREGGRLFPVDLLPDAPGPQLAVIGRSELHVLDLDLRRLGGVTIHGERPPLSIEAWHADSTTRLLLLADGISPAFAFVRAPRSVHPAWFAGGAAAVASLAGVAWRRQQRRRRSGQVETDPVILRELRLQLLARLQKGGHEKIGALSALRRLVWRLEAEAVREQEGAAGARSAESRQRVVVAVAVFADDTRPGLEEILTLARRTGAADHQVGVIQELLADLTGTLEAADAPDVVFADLHHRANALAEEAEAALQRLRRQVEACFECDLALAVARVLQAQAEELERHRVQALATGLAAVPGARVALDLPDLEFVLDNLVGNAIRAMTDTVERRLTVDATRSAGQVAVTVADTGCGMAPEDWEAVFDDRWSTRPGGGYGLARSRRELAVYGGTLRVVRSAPGQGTTFLLILPVAPGPDLHRP